MCSSTWKRSVYRCRLGIKYQTGNGHKLENAPQLRLGYSPRLLLLYSFAKHHVHARFYIRELVHSGPRGRARGRTTLGVHPFSWLLSNNRLEKEPFVSVPHTSSNRLLLSNQDKGCAPSVAHSLALPLGPALHNVWIVNSPPAQSVRVYNDLMGQRANTAKLNWLMYNVEYME